MTAQAIPPAANDARPHAVATDDLLHLLTVFVRKAEREPETSETALRHVQRVFDKIVERVS